MSQMQTRQANPMVAVKSILEDHKNKIEVAMPQYLRGQLPRFIAVALLTISRSRQSIECTPESLLASVIDGARQGLMVDGKLGHIIVYNNKKKLPNGQETWVKEAQFQADYKGLVAIARRTKVVSDIYADVVRSRDVFEHGLKNGEQHLEHTYRLNEPRGELIGAYCRLLFPDGRWAYRLIDVEHIEKARNASKSPDKGPWADWYEEMAKKTAVRAALKLYSDDPDIAMALEIDDRHFVNTPIDDRRNLPMPVSTLDDVASVLKERRGPAPAVIEAEVNPPEPAIEAAQPQAPFEAITPFEAAQIAEQQAEQKPKKPAKQGQLIDTSDPFKGTGN